MVTFEEFRGRLFSEPLALEAGAMHRLVAYMGSRAGELDEDAVAEMGEIVGAVRVNPRAPGAVAVIPFQGFVQQREDFWTKVGLAVSTEAFVRQVRQAQADPNVKAVVFDVDSPGGFVSGCPEACEAILALRGQKPMVAVSNGMMASAAYFVAGAADEVVSTPSSLTGSIGVFGMHVDYSEALALAGIKPTFISAGKFKVEGNPYEPLGDEAREALQREVDEFYGQFVNGVAKSRGVSASDVRAGYGQGRVLPARMAKEAGLVARVASMEEVLRKFGVTEGRREEGGGMRGEVERERERLELWKGS